VSAESLNHLRAPKHRGEHDRSHADAVVGVGVKVRASRNQQGGDVPVASGGHAAQGRLAVVIAASRRRLELIVDRCFAVLSEALADVDATIRRGRNDRGS
jgi:hypothetical protein